MLGRPIVIEVAMVDIGMPTIRPASRPQPRIWRSIERLLSGREAKSSTPDRLRAIGQTGDLRAIGPSAEPIRLRPARMRRISRALRHQPEFARLARRLGAPPR